MKRILLIATGGTIACSEGDSGLAPTLTAGNLLEHVAEVRDVCSIGTEQIMNIDSTNMQPEYWVDMVRYIEENYNGYDGFVITHGTDTMAYTSAALFYMIQNSGKPIVITGAQKPISLADTDAKRNLADAIRFACEGIGGVYIVFDGKVINGARAAKLRTRSYNAFESINYPFLATIDGENIIYNGSVSIVRRENGPVFYKSICTDVFLLKLTPGMDPDILDYLSGRYSAIIVETYGIGGVPFQGKRNFLGKIQELSSAGKIIVITTQVLLEGTDLTLYEVGRKALESLIIPAYDMSREAIVTKAMWILGQTGDREKVREMFLTPINGDLIIGVGG